MLFDNLFYFLGNPGTKAGDPVEICAIDKVFCSNRKKPLLVGALKSNMGHSENCAAHGQIIKVRLISVLNALLVA